jgi:hypothetical protein
LFVGQGGLTAIGEQWGCRQREECAENGNVDRVSH